VSIEAIGVVVPARDEEALLPHCLDHLEAAAAAVAGIPVYVVVVLDACVDGSAEVVAARPWVTPVAIEARNVGRARRAGTTEVLNRYADVAPGSVWLAMTDADSAVPPGWLSGQLALAAEGWDAVVGTVSVADWSGREPNVRARWGERYCAIEHHPHVHGANLGFTAAAYLDAGGWPTLPAHEDVAFLSLLSAHRIVATATLPVVTSARSDPRAVGGFGDALGDLAG
jgi:glycosyltransferase involved in cell wall biosynthesis